ncbi:sugar kinase [Pseudoalteromonas rhizosphaerae]|uniref:sugar kinase n=1 Tax=Pseudoalteromonas rhizosphaerae TaxID=2518973 RepID=UPI001230828F|nr:sugar kinase [Pseudoalteromonas rhizosphaerae]
MTPKSIAIIGECMVELSGQPFTAMQQNYGGDSMNTAIYLKKLAGNEVNVNYVSAMGTDPLSRALIEKWQAHHINTDNVLLSHNKQPGLYMIQNDVSGERTFQYWRSDSAAKYLLQHTDFKKVLTSLAEVDAIYLSGISLAILAEQDCHTLLSHLALLKQQGIKIIYDSNYRPALWSSKMHCHLANNKAYALADLALVTFDDEAQLWGDSNVTQCTERLHQQGAHEVVVKLGADGCQYSKKHLDNSISVELFSTVKIANVVDTTAAGDSFNAGFLAQWLTEQPIKQCAQAGNLLAAQVIQKRGAIVEVDIATIKHTIKA